MFAFSGYVAAIECSSVHVERPSSSTSGGQSEGVSLGERVAAAAKAEVEVGILLVLDVGVEVELEFVLLRSACLVNARHEATEVQVRQGFPSLSKTTPLGNGAFESSSPVGLDELAEVAGVCWLNIDVVPLYWLLTCSGGTEDIFSLVQV